MRQYLLLVTFLASLATIVFIVPAAAQDRTYYIAADEVMWNYAPGGMGPNYRQASTKAATDARRLYLQKSHLSRIH